MPAHSGAAASTDLDLADLEKLVPELIARDLQADMQTPAGKLSYLEVRNPHVQVLTEKVYAQADAYWFAHAERIAGCDEVTKAADILARILHATANTTGDLARRPAVMNRGQAGGSARWRYPRPDTTRRAMTQPTQPDPTGSQTSGDPASLASALTQRGYDANVITPAPYLTVRIPGAVLPQMIYASGGSFWWRGAQVIAPCGHVPRAAETIVWALRAHPHDSGTHDATAPVAAASVSASRRQPGSLPPWPGVL
jgi:hypothetical protein